MNVGYRLPARFATTTEIAVAPLDDRGNEWEVIRQNSTEIDEVVVRVDASFDPNHESHRAEMTRLRDALNAALGVVPTKVTTYEHKPIPRTVEVLEMLEEPHDLTGLTPAWRERVHGLIAFTSANHEDIADCADCGDHDPNPVGYRYVDVDREGPVFDWHPTVGVLEAGVLRWLCGECALVPEPASTTQVEQAARSLAAGVKW